MKSVIMIVGALIVLAGGGAGAYFYFTGEAEASAPQDQADKIAEKKSKEKKETYKFEYVELDPLILPIVDKNGVSQVVSLVVALEVIDSKSASLARDYSPKLKDAYIQDLYGLLNEKAVLKGGVIQVGYLKDRLNKVSQTVLTNGEINDVLLQVVQQRPI
ncbi:MAG: flagellar basal body-associated protein FliL [Bdellovibrionales bacterium]